MLLIESVFNFEVGCSDFWLGVLIALILLMEADLGKICDLSMCEGVGTIMPYRLSVSATGGEYYSRRYCLEDVAYHQDYLYL